MLFPHMFVRLELVDARSLTLFHAISNSSWDGHVCAMKPCEQKGARAIRCCKTN